MLQDELAPVPQCIPTSVDQSAFAILERLRHSHQLSTRAQPTSLRQRTSSLSCATVLAVFRLDLVRKELCTNVCTKISPVPLLNETTMRQNWHLNCTRVEKHSNCLSFWKSVCHHRPPPSSWSRAPIAVWIPGSANGTFLSWILDRTCVNVCTTVKKQILCTSFVSL